MDAGMQKRAVSFFESTTRKIYLMKATSNFAHDFTPSEFQKPSAAWRGKPFWSWNGRLELDELIRQIHVLKDMGMGGFFMHSRIGLATEYLG